MRLPKVIHLLITLNYELIYYIYIFFLILVLVGLYEEPERPPNAVDYIKRYMGAPAGVDVEALRAEVEQLKIDKANLEAALKEMNARVSFIG
jgi:hypothetical protein